MTKSLYLPLLLLGMLTLTGCGNKADSLMQQSIDDMNKFADAMESGADGKTELKTFQERMEKTGEALEALNLSDKEKEALKEKHKDKLEAAAKRMAKAMFGGMGQGMMQGMLENMNSNMPANMPQMPASP